MNDLNNIRELFARTNKRVDANYALTAHGEYLLEMADQYYIPYDVENPHWLQLIDLVNDYIKLVEKAAYHRLAWDYSYYDPIALQYEIEEYERECALEATKDYHMSYQEKLA